jgi:hypothetical protein
MPKVISIGQRNDLVELFRHLGNQQLGARSRLAVITEDCAAPAVFVATIVKFDGSQYLVRPFG